MIGIDPQSAYNLGNLEFLALPDYSDDFDKNTHFVTTSTAVVI